MAFEQTNRRICSESSPVWALERVPTYCHVRRTTARSSLRCIPGQKMSPSWQPARSLVCLSHVADALGAVVGRPDVQSLHLVVYRLKLSIAGRKVTMISSLSVMITVASPSTSFTPNCRGCFPICGLLGVHGPQGKMLNIPSVNTLARVYHWQGSDDGLPPTLPTARLGGDSPARLLGCRLGRTTDGVPVD